MRGQSASGTQSISESLGPLPGSSVRVGFCVAPQYISLLISGTQCP